MAWVLGIEADYIVGQRASALTSVESHEEAKGLTTGMGVRADDTFRITLNTSDVKQALAVYFPVLKSLQLDS